MRPASLAEPVVHGYRHAVRRATQSDASPGAWVERWLSAGRFQTFLNAAPADRTRALDLYEWSARMSAAVMHDLAHLEVAMHNVYNGALEARQPGPLHWIDDLVRYFPCRRGRAADGTVIDHNATPPTTGGMAINGAGGSTAPKGKTVAELSFGFWALRHHPRP